MSPELREHQLEDILAAHPDDFFPDRGFRLIGRQQSFAGVGRFDLLFEDLANRRWLIELKAVSLKITDTDQVMRYHEELQSRARGEALIPCFVAPHVPPHVRTYLDGKGIEYREITLAEFGRVAAAHQMSWSSQIPSPDSRLAPDSRSLQDGEPYDSGSDISRWDYERYRRMFENLGFQTFKRATLLKHPQLQISLYFDTGSQYGVFFTGYRKDSNRFKPALWRVLKPLDKKRSDPRYRLVAPVAGSEESAFRDLMTSV